MQYIRSEYFTLAGKLSLTTIVILKGVCLITKFKKNFIFALVTSLTFIILEEIFRISSQNLINFLKISDYLTIVILFVFISFLENKFAKKILFFLSTIFIVQIIHFNYFGYFLFPMEFILFFTKFHETFETLVTRLDIFFVPIFFVVILIALCMKIFEYTKNRVIFKKSKYLLALFIIIPILNTAIHYKKRTLGDRPNTDKSIIKNSLYVTKTFLGKTLPLYIFDIQIVNKYNDSPQYTKVQKNQIDNVILVIGESLSLHYMSLYGYKKDTTPELNKLSKLDNIYVSKALSAGVFTDCSIPMILNVAQRPNAIEHILSNKANLFKMAKNNNFATYWISAQAKDGFSYIRSYMGLKYIDNYIDSSNFGFDKYTSVLDHILYDKLTSIDLNNKKNFIVLNMIGSHSPYSTRVPQSFKPFGNKNDLNNYENTVAYTDKIISNIILYLKNNVQSKTLLIFTSDHGQSVGRNGYGHGNIKNHKHYEVPLILFSNNFKLNQNIKNILHNNFVSHYTMAQIAAKYLGYDSEQYIRANKAYIIGNELSGNGGYIKYDLKTGSVSYR